MEPPLEHYYEATIRYEECYEVYEGSIEVNETTVFPFPPRHHAFGKLVTHLAGWYEVQRVVPVEVQPVERNAERLSHLQVVANRSHDQPG